MTPKRVLLFAAIGTEAERVAELCRRAFPDVSVYHGDWKQPFPEACLSWDGDLIVSYCSRWVVPETLLPNAAFAAINFHPGSPEYPGIGGLNWALFNEDRIFGVTCHHMKPKVDAGEIIEDRHFPILPSDDVQSLFNRTHLHLEALASDILTRVAMGLELPKSSAQWSGKCRSRNELNELASITYEMNEEEIRRRIRATNFGIWKPTIKIGSYLFELKI